MGGCQTWGCRGALRANHENVNEPVMKMINVLVSLKDKTGEYRYKSK